MERRATARHHVDSVYLLADARIDAKALVRARQLQPLFDQYRHRSSQAGLVPTDEMRRARWFGFADPEAERQWNGCDCGPGPANPSFQG